MEHCSAMLGKWTWNLCSVITIRFVGSCWLNPQVEILSTEAFAGDVRLGDVLMKYLLLERKKEQ